MNGKNLWIKKYSYLPGTGYLYLAADFKRMEEGPSVILHEITVNFETAEEQRFEHRACKYNVKEHLSHEVSLSRIVRAIIDRHLSAYASQAGSDNGRMPLEEVDSGIDVLTELQFTEIFPELKVRILKEPRSDTFSKILTNMAHLPLRMERREKAVKSPRIAGLVGG